MIIGFDQDGCASVYEIVYKEVKYDSVISMGSGSELVGKMHWSGSFTLDEALVECIFIS